MDRLALAGLLLALGAILAGHMWEGGSALALLHLPAFVIVVGGTLGAVMLQTPWPQFNAGIRLLPWLLFPPQSRQPQLRKAVVAWASTARQKGFLALERELDGLQDPFERRALAMLIDGEEGHNIRDLLDTEIILYRERMLRAARIFESMGGYAPTLGIIGAVLGLIQAMGHLTDPGQLGSGIATAFVATIYGVGFANILFLPVAHKLRAIILQQVLDKELLAEGILALSQGESPKRIQSRLDAYVHG